MVEKIPGIADAHARGREARRQGAGEIEAMISSMTDDERRHPERFVVTSWEEVVEGGKRKKKRSAFYDQSRLRARGARLGPQGERGRGPAEPVRDDAADDDADRDVDRPARQDPGLQAAGADEEDGRASTSTSWRSMMNTPSAERGHFQAPKRNVDRAKEKRKRKDAARRARRRASAVRRDDAPASAVRPQRERASACQRRGRLVGARPRPRPWPRASGTTTAATMANSTPRRSQRSSCAAPADLVCS